jgi:hypothetical protein
MKVLTRIGILTAMMISFGSLAVDLKRLDPHGTREMKLREVNLKKHSECLVCHLAKGQGLKPHPEQVCASCHGAAPHSGAAEHLKDPQITCLSCHFPHRADPVLKVSSEKPLFEVIKRKADEISADLREKSHSNPRLRKRCEDCHKW